MKSLGELFFGWRVDFDIVWRCAICSFVGLHNILPLNFLAFGFCHHISIEIHSAKSKAEQCHRVFLQAVCVHVSFSPQQRRWKMENVMGPASLLLGCLLLWHEFGRWDFFTVKASTRVQKSQKQRISKMLESQAQTTMFIY